MFFIDLLTMNNYTQKILKSIFLTTLIAITSLAQAADITPFSATYHLNINGKTGTATRTLSQSGNSFTYKMSARAAGIATANQISNFSLSGNQISPTSSSTSYHIAGVGNTHSIRFFGNQAVSTYKGKSTTIATPSGGYDDLSLEMQIRQELLNGKFEGSYTLVRKTSAEIASFRHAGTAKITTPAGTYDVIRIDRIHDDKERATSFWLATSLDYLPIQISQTNNGKTISMSLAKID